MQKIIVVIVANGQLNQVYATREMRLSHQSDCSLLDIYFFFRVRFSFKEGSCGVSFCCLWYAWIQNSRKHLSSVINVDLTLTTSSQCRIQDFSDERQSNIWPIQLTPPPLELHKNGKKMYTYTWGLNLCWVCEENTVFHKLVMEEWFINIFIK